MEALTTTEPAAIEYVDDSDSTVTHVWRIENLQSADWALMRLAECEAEAKEIDAQAAAAIERIRRRAEELKARVASGASFFRFKLTEFAEMHRDTLLQGKAKSRNFVHGALRWRSSQARLVVVDPKALEAWLATQPVEAGLYRVRVEPELRALQERFKQTGEVFPGCDQKPGTESLTIEAIAPERALKE